MSIHSSVLGEREIRLLTILPGRTTDHIQCSLEVVSLNSELKYQALSYVWGSEDNLKTIHVEDKPFGVTQNLYSALLHLRSFDEARVIWIDAICINQANKYEKGPQIGLMGEIYTKTSRLIIYSGERDNQTDLAFNTVVSINGELEWQLRNGLRSTRTFWQDLRLNETTFFRDRNEVQPFDPEPWVAINSLYKRSWWTRVWTAQETILPDGDADFHCGNRSISWLALQRVSLMLAHFDFGPVRSQMLLLAGYSLVHSLFERPIHAQKELRRAAIIERNTNGNSLIEYLVGYYQRQCREPKDLIFGFLGVCLDASADILGIGYTQSVEQLFTAVAAFWVKQDRDPRFISLCQSNGRGPSLPSWVPDWRIERPDILKIEQIPNVLQQIMEMGRAIRPPVFIENWTGQSIHTFQCAPTPDHGLKQPSLSPNNLVLTLKGLTHSQITFIGQDAFDISSDAVWHWLTLINDHVQDPYPTGQSRLESLWRTLVTNRTSSFQLATPDLFVYALSDWAVQLIDRGLEDPSQRSQLGATVMRFFVSVAYRALAGRLFFVTNSGYMGLAPKDVAVGDHVCLLFGVPVPMILRARAGGGHEIIGPSYVHGIMQGEAFESWKQSQILEETFAIH